MPFDETGLILRRSLFHAKKKKKKKKKTALIFYGVNIH